MNKTISTKIIALKKTAYQESSLIISSISAEYGKIDFVVKGARRISKKEQPIVDIFRELAVEFRETRSGLNNPQSLDLVEEYDKIALNPSVFIEVSRLASFLLRNIYPHVPCNRVYSAFKNLLRKSADGSIKTFDFTLLKLVFLFENGFLPAHFETNSDSSFQYTVEEKKQHKFLNRLISYAEGNILNIPVLSTEYQNKFSDWVINQCRYNGLE
jgi:DNA repair protein RecO